MKYANYIHACVQTLLVGKRNRVVHLADAQLRLRHATISRVQNSAMFSHFANQTVSGPALCAIYIFHGKGLLVWRSLATVGAKSEGRWQQFRACSRAGLEFEPKVL